MDYAEAYFESAHEEGFVTRNSVIDLATTDISCEEMREQIQKLHDEAINQKKELTEETMAGITTQMISSLGLSEENMQAFQELIVNILKDSGNKNIGK